MIYILIFYFIFYLLLIILNLGSCTVKGTWHLCIEIYDFWVDWLVIYTGPWIIFEFWDSGAFTSHERGGVPISWLYPFVLLPDVGPFCPFAEAAGHKSSASQHLLCKFFLGFRSQVHSLSYKLRIVDPWSANNHTISGP